MRRPAGRDCRSRVICAAGEGAGLVAAQHVDAAEVLHRRQVLDDDVPPRHPHCALRQRDGGDHRQELGRQPDRQRDREQQRLERVVPLMAAPTVTTKTNSTRKKTVRMIRKPNCRVPRSNSVSGGRVASRAAMSPNCGRRAGAVTRAVAVPLTTDVPRKTALRASSGLRGAPGPRPRLPSRPAAISPVRAAC